MTERKKDKTITCPVCENDWFIEFNTLGPGSRICSECQTIWWINIDYAKIDINQL